MTYTNSDDFDSNSHRSRRGGTARGGSGRGARKERVLHTRVSEQLSEDIRAFAEDLRVPASNLVRNVLEEVFTVVDGVSNDVGGIFDELLREAEGVRERIRREPGAGGRGRRAASRGDSRRQRSRGRHRHRGADEGDLEEELRADEASESRDGGSARRQTQRSDGATHDATDSTSEGDPNAAAPENELSSPGELFPDVLGWQPLVLNRAFECGRCHRALGAGESAFLGLTAAGLTDTALCGRCAGSR